LANKRSRERRKARAQTRGEGKVSATLEARDDATTAFVVRARHIAFHAADYGRWSLYERLKAMAQADLPHLSHVEYAALMHKLARIAGV
jgi:hypothetical protein